MDTIIDDLNQIMVPVGHSKHFVPVSLRNSRVIYKQAICFATQLIGEDGTFNGVGLDNFMKKVKLGERGASHAVVAIMGPQCSGKSTLLNHLFHTNFKEMDASKGRSPTTKGLWIAKAAGTEPCTIVMDLQGTDQSELGEDDAAFAKQSARFVLAISDVVIINMWCRDIGLEQAASKRLMETIFQVMCWQSSIPSKTTLMFVIRDPVTLMQGKKFLSDMNKIWNSIPKSEAHKHTKLTENFNIQFVKLPSYEDGAERFKNQVARLRKILLESIVTPPASGFSFSAQQIWKAIKENKEIDLAGHKAEVRKKWNARPWTTKEETVLAQAWMNSPLNNKPWRLRRKSGSLWKQVLEYFRNQTGDTDRPVDQMNSKWKRMEQKITKFNDIYHRIAKHYNSQSESGILHFTHLEYRRLNDKPFANEAAWAIVKSHPKWSPSSSPSTVHPINPHIQHQKRLKISELESSSHTTLSNAHDSSSRDDEEDQRIIDEELELPQQIQETLVSSSSGQQDRVEQLQKLISEVTEISHILREDLEDKKRHRLKLEEIKLGKVRIMEVMEEQLQRTQKEKDLKFYLQPHDHLTGMELKVALRYKEEITRRWGWE